jgi:hypothetical protein
MFNRLLVSSVAAALLAWPGAVAAQSFGLSAGLSAPTGDFSNESATGFNFNGIFNVAFPPSVVGFRAEAGINMFSLKGTGIGTTRILNATGNIVIAAPGIAAAHPYLIGGIGVYQVNYPDGSGQVLYPSIPIGTGARGGSDTRMGFNGGIGASIDWGHYGGLLEARYVSINKAGRHPAAGFIPISIGILF